MGIVAVMMLASAASTVWFLRGEADEGGFLGWEGQVIAGVLSVGATGGILVYGVLNVLEVAPGSPAYAEWLVGVLIVTVFGLGVAGALFLKATRPSVYAGLRAEQRVASRPLPPRPANSDGMASVPTFGGIPSGAPPQ